VRASGVDFSVRIHDLRHAHASWRLAVERTSGQ
jgi:integrase